ncbi:MAG: tRNA lysidine(34) synthetase TilS [Actinomycetes bacterium]
MDDALWQLRREVHRALADVEAGQVVVVALSGGADSLALAAATAAEGTASAWQVVGVVVDHGLQSDSARVAQSAAAQADALGLTRTEVVRVDVPTDGSGPEAAARTARYEALSEVAARTGAAAVVLGHTLDDQAESVLLGLARGSGARSLSGMPERRGLFRRPFLSVRRALTRQVCRDLGLAPWDDPHNTDPSFARVRVRTTALPALEVALGGRVVESLARTADQLRDDDEALAAWALEVLEEVDGDGLDVDALARRPAAVRRRVLRLAALREDVPPGALSFAHLAALDALVAHWHGQGAVALPGGVFGERRCGRLYLARRSTRQSARPSARPSTQ